jgi:Lar family restriction alleviation protein
MKRDRKMLDAYAHSSLKSARPCPFCGSATLGMFPGPSPRTIRRDTFRVMCGGCQCAGPIAMSPDKAVARWNGDFANAIKGPFRT